jgi:hypothetical protein
MAEAAVRERLDALIRDSGEGYAALSRLLGRNPAYIQQYIKRGVPRRLGESERRLLAEHFGVSERFLGGPEPPAVRSPPRPARNRADAPDALHIPYLDPDSGVVPKTDRPALLAFDRGIARLLAGDRTESLAALTVEGDAMFPTLAGGDEILVDIGERRGLRDGIYVIRADGALLVKRLSVHPVTGRVSILSDNAAYPSFPDCDPERIAVIGRVRWVGRRLT